MLRNYEILIKGKGGHASMPQQANNPILIAAELILQFQALPENLFGRGKKAGARVTALEAGDKGNIIPEQAKIRLEIYAQEEELTKMQERYLNFGREFIRARSAEALIREIEISDKE